MKLKLVMFVLVILFLTPLIALAQDLPPEPPRSNVELALAWIVTFIAAWQAIGITFSAVIENTVKPAAVKILDTLNLPPGWKSPIIVVVVIVAAVVVTSQNGINLLSEDPFGYFANLSPTLLFLLNAALVAASAFMGHRIWDWLVGTSKKAQQIGSIVSSITTLQTSGDPVINPGMTSSSTEIKSQTNISDPVPDERLTPNNSEPI